MEQQNYELPEGVNAEDFVIGRIKKSLPKLLKTHKADLIVILAAIEGVDPKEYEENLDLVKILTRTAELLNDPVFLQLFMKPPHLQFPLYLHA